MEMEDMETNKNVIARFRWLAIVLSFVVCHLTFTPAGAQTFTQDLQKIKQGEGTVTLHQDKAIDDLVNGTQPVQHASQPKKGEEKSKNDKLKAKLKDPLKDKLLEVKISKDDDDDLRPIRESADTTGLDKKASRTYKAIGYRVQAFAGGNSRHDRQKAEQTGNQLRALFPTEQVYTHFYSPRWICRMGNYRTYEEAHKMLLEVQKLGYSSATIVKGRISVAY